MKMKRLLFALVILTTIAAAAPDALADHCYRCYNYTTCGPSTGYGRDYCSDSTGRCVFYGYECGGPHPFTEPLEPLAAEFVVASVERLDEPQPQQPSDETRIASLDTTRQTAER